jgi:hypothetical protein
MENETQITPLQARKAEVAGYEANIAMYETILAGLPTKWPERLVQYRDAADKHKVAGEIDNLDDVSLLSKLWYADDCYKAIRSETVEKTKAEAILNTLEANG